MKVWIVEYRHSEEESVVLHVASSEEKARAYCVENGDDVRDYPNEWFVILDEEVDGAFIQDTALIFYDNRGNQIPEQPWGREV